MTPRHIGLLFAGLLLLAAGAQGAERRLFLVHSYHPEFAWTRQCDQGLRTALGDRYRVESFYMDTKRLAPTDFGERARLAWQAVETFDPELVLVGDDNALRLLAPWIAKSQRPVVYFGINGNPRDYFHQLPANLTGVLERTPVLSWLRQLPGLLPEARRGVILLDDSPTSQGIVEMTYNDRHQVSSGPLEVDYRRVTHWSQWQQAVREAPLRYDFIVMASYFTLKDAQGRPVDEMEVVRWSSAHTRIPLFANQDYAVNDTGAIGAVVVSGERHGALAATLVKQVLEDGRMPRHIFPLTDREGTFFFNKKQLERFALALPAGLEARAQYR